MSIEALIDRAMADRPELMAQTLLIRSAEACIRAARAEYKPQIVLSGSGAQTSLWPTADYGQLGSASEPTWSVALSIQWRIFDGGVRKNDLLIAESKRREAEDKLTAKHDQTTRQPHRWILFAIRSLVTGCSSLGIYGIVPHTELLVKNTYIHSIGALLAPRS
jgi:outer membrane protein